MAFVPSQYSDAGSAALALAPLAIEAGTTIATTAITGKRPKGRKRHPPAAPPPPPPSMIGGLPLMPVVLGGLALLGTVAFVVFRPKRAPARHYGDHDTGASQDSGSEAA